MASLMISLLQISETAQGLVLSYPAWTAVVLALVAAALVAFAVLARARLKRPWPVALAIVLAAWGAVHVATFRAAVTAEGGSAYAFLRYEHSVRWRDAADIWLERAASGGWQIVVTDVNARAYVFDVTELAVEERDRVMAYIADRMPQSAFKAPELLRRHAPVSVRPVGLFADQQI